MELPGHRTSRHVSGKDKGGRERKEEKKVDGWSSFSFRALGGGTSLCHETPLTLAFPLVLHVQVRVAFAFRLQQRALVFVGLSVRAADGSLPGDVGAVWRAHAARLAPPVHLAPFPRTTVDVVAGF